MKVSVIGTGYVGLVSGTCFAEMGHEVTCIDIDAIKIDKLQSGVIPIYEPGLKEIVLRNIEKKRLSFSTNYDSVGASQCIFLAVGTPSTDDGQADLKYLEAAAIDTAKNLSDGTIVVIKSTVPVGTSGKIVKIIQENTDKVFHVVNNPEFLKEGSAVDDFMKPDRVVIGYSEEVAASVMEELYQPLMLQGNPIYKMSNTSAEMTKYAANCFLATKISFINEMAKLCDLTGADIEEVRAGITSDVRIGKHFLYPGPGYGGSCFPKDVKALMHTAREHETELSIVKAADEVNDRQKVYMAEKIKNAMGQDLTGKSFAFWGVAFKPNTDDIREAPAIYIAKNLIEAGATIKFYDPIANDNYKAYMDEKYSFGDKLQACNSMYDAIIDCDALVLLTEWREFRAPNFGTIKSKLKSPNLFDARNLYPTNMIKKLEFNYYAVGKHI